MLEDPRFGCLSFQASSWEPMRERLPVGAKRTSQRPKCGSAYDLSGHSCPTEQPVRLPGPVIRNPP